METVWAVVGALLIFVVLWDSFETIILPRRVTRRIRLARLFYRYSWRLYSRLIASMLSPRRQEAFLSYFGPLSLLALISLWALGLIFGFSLLYASIGSALLAQRGTADFFSSLYFSGTTFFTLGLGDVVPNSSVARLLVVLEAGTGFAFLALIVAYLPTLTQSFSRRETSISLLDARAGSPPTAVEMLLRHRGPHGIEALRQLLHEWERWSAEFLEIHLSYPVLAYFRSQHDNQSWLAALTAILDTCALTMTGISGACRRQAELTFAIARHAVVDLAIVFGTVPRVPVPERLTETGLARIYDLLYKAGLKLKRGKEAERNLKELRGMYEPYVNALARHMRLTIPSWTGSITQKDNWQTSAWEMPAGKNARRRNTHF
jgi:hypothetical protein